MYMPKFLGIVEGGFSQAGFPTGHAGKSGLAVSTEPSAFNIDVMFYVPNLNFFVC